MKVMDQKNEAGLVTGAGRLHLDRYTEVEANGHNSR